MYPGNGFVPRSVTPGRHRHYAPKEAAGPVALAEPMVAEPVEGSRGGDSISVAIRFRPLRWERVVGVWGGVCLDLVGDGVDL